MGEDLLNMFLDCSSDNLIHPWGQPMANNGIQSFNPRHWACPFGRVICFLILSTVVIEQFLRGNKSDCIRSYICIACNCAQALPIVESLSENTVTSKNCTPSGGWFFTK